MLNLRLQVLLNTRRGDFIATQKPFGRELVIIITGHAMSVGREKRQML